ncbi:MAG: hypothetical protein GXY75_07880 [Bacteroidales bacterium]|jgi:hypothetical protein|nr:hypothetical protein [Bacteroidales bacterium]
MKFKLRLLFGALVGFVTYLLTIGVIRWLPAKQPIEGAILGVYRYSDFISAFLVVVVVVLFQIRQKRKEKK